MNEEIYQPGPPLSLVDAGLNEALVDSLVCKLLLVRGRSSGRSIAP